MSRGVIIEIAEQSILVMTTDGEFKQVAKQGRNCQLGEEISFVDTYKKPLINWRAPRPFAIAAASIFCLMIVAVLSFFNEGGSSNRVAAYVTMDINPSIEVGIDKIENVVEVRGINDDGIELLKDITFDGLTLDAFSDLIVQRIELGHYLDSGEADIIIASTVLTKGQKDYDIELSEKVKLKLIDAINKTHTVPSEKIVVTAITAPQEVRNEAIAQGVSTGKKAVQLLTRNNQKSTSDEELKEKPIQQMIMENGGIAEILPKERIITKEEFKSILKEIHAEKEDSKKDIDSKKDNDKAKDDDNKIDRDNENNNQEANVELNKEQEKDLRDKQKQEDLKSKEDEQQNKEDEQESKKDEQRSKKEKIKEVREKEKDEREIEKIKQEFEKEESELKKKFEINLDKIGRNSQTRNNRQDIDAKWWVWGR